MRMVINSWYGGYIIPQKAIDDGVFKNKKLSKYDKTTRTDPNFIEWILSNKDSCGTLKVIELPKEHTDYYINDYDGIEEVIYVLNGKIKWAESLPFYE